MFFFLSTVRDEIEGHCERQAQVSQHVLSLSSMIRKRDKVDNIGRRRLCRYPLGPRVEIK